MNVSLDHGASLISTAMAATDRIAVRWARHDLSDLAGDVVELAGRKHEVRIGAAVVRAASEMEGALLDVLA